MTKFFRSRQKNYNKIIIFKKCFSSKTSPGHVEWSSEKHTAICSAINLGNLLLKVRQTFPQGTRGTKKPFFFHYFYFFKSSPGRAECTFGKPCRYLFAQVPNFFTQSTKLVRNLLFSIFSSQNFSGHVNWSFGNPAVNVWQKSTMILLKVEKVIKNHPFFNEKCSQYSSGHAECSFDNPCRIAFPRVEKILPEVQLFKKKFLKKSLSRIVSLEMEVVVLKTLSLIFSQHPKIFRSRNETTKIPSILQKNFRKMFSWTRKLMFWKLCLNCFREKSRKVSLKIRNFLGNHHFFKKVFKMFSWTRRMWILKPCFEFFCSKSENFFLKIQKILRIYHFFKRFSEDDSLDT